VFRSHIQRLTVEAQLPGRPSILTNDELHIIRNMVLQHFLEQMPVTYADLNDFIQYEFHKDILPGTLRHYLRRTKCIKSVT
jgi:hypothetical protein